MNRDDRLKKLAFLAKDACDRFKRDAPFTVERGHALVLLFLKYASDLTRMSHVSRSPRVDMDPRGATRGNPFSISGPDYNELYAARNEPDIGARINRAIERIVHDHPRKLDGVFEGIDFDSDEQLGPNPRRKTALAGLIVGIGELEFTRDDIGPESPVAGELFSFLLRTLFADDAKSIRGLFMTPPEISGLLAELLDVRPGETVCDPCCGAGSSLITVGAASISGDITLFGQDINPSSVALCRLNMLMHGLHDRAIIECGDSLHDPKFLEKGRLRQFDVVVSHPPFGAGNWGGEQIKLYHERFYRGRPPKNKADFAYLSHLLAIAKESSGRVGVIVSRGVLFREAVEKTIRREFIREGVLDAVIALPPNLVPDTPIATAILIFNKAKKNKDVMFIDASQGGLNGISDMTRRGNAASQVAQWYRGDSIDESRARRVTFAEIEANDYNLNIPLYFSAGQKPHGATTESALRAEIIKLEAEVSEIRRRLDELLRE